MAYDILNLPNRLFKYYSTDERLLKKRLAGEVYLACPFDFNDPCDCQREVINNSKEREEEKGDGWLASKLIELDYTPEESKVVAKSLLADDSKLKEVHKKQLEKVGILCMTSNQAQVLMWGYYANNDGVCIEYDTKKILKSLVIGFINELDYVKTRYLFQDEDYYMIPEQRTSKLKKSIIKKAMEFKPSDLKKITNLYLLEQDDKLKVLNFVRNIFLKRLYARSIVYNVKPDGSPSTLFFDRTNNSSESKYFIKTRIWDHEDEFRFVFSLGGRKVIKLGKECVKNIYLGCNTKNEQIVKISYMLHSLDMKVELYRMQRLKNCGLSPVGIEWSQYVDNFGEMKKYLENRFPE